MPTASRFALLAFVLLFVFASRAGATPIGIFDAATDDRIVITFQFPARPPGPSHQLSLGLGGSLVPPSPGLQGCNFQLSVGGSVVSSATVNSAFGCQGNWVSGDGTGVALLIDSGVDLSGIAAGEEATLSLQPTFLGPGGIESLAEPSLFFDGAANGTILSQTITAIPEPSTLSLGLVGIAVIAAGRRRLRRE